MKGDSTNLSMDGEITCVKYTPNALVFTGKATVLKVVVNYTKPDEMEIREVALSGFVRNIAYNPDFNLMAVAMVSSVVFFDTRVRSTYYFPSFS